MKKLYFLLVVLAVMSACKKDENTTPKNNITYDGKTYELAKGYLENYGYVDDGLYNFDMTLVSDGLTLTENGDASGVGNIIYFEMLSPSPTELSAGTYTFSVNFNTAYTFATGFVGLDFDIANFTGTFLNLVGGTVTVAKDGGNYKITFNGVQASAKAVTGSYEGTLIYYDYSN
jgi:hypothetical protein